MTKVDRKTTDYQPGKVSVILPVWNAEKTIEIALKSIEVQNYPDLEILAVDDASEDRSWSILEVKANHDSRLKIFRNPNNEGAAVTRNQAISMASGQYLAFLDADDEWLPNKLNNQIEFMKSKGAHFSCTALERLNVTTKRRKTNDVPEYASLTDLLKNNTIGTSTVIYEKPVFPEFRMPLIRRRQDYGLWLQLARHCGGVYGLNEVLTVYKYGHDSLSSNKIKAAKDQWTFFRTVEKMSIPTASWYFAHYAWNATRRQ